MEKFNDWPYERPDVEKIKKDLGQLIEEFKTASSSQQQVKIMKKVNDISNEYHSLATIASIRNSIDTRDEFYEKERDFYDDISPEISDIFFEYYQALSQTNFKKELVEEFGEQIFIYADFQVKSFDKAIINDLKEENKLVSSYSKLVAGAKIEFDGKELNLSQLAPYGQKADRETRKKAMDARYDFVKENQGQFDSIYDKSVKLRHQMAQKMGFDNYVPLGYLQMQRADYTPEMVADYRQQVLEHIVPLTVRLRERQAKRIGIKDFKYYDQGFHFTSGNAMPKGDAKYIVSNGEKMYHELSEETGEFFDLMIANDLMDLETKKGKDIGGYCTYIPKYRAPFIFSNFNGTSADIDVLTHEAGHAFQVYSSRDQKLSEYLWPTYESAEIHSMSMEFFTWPWMSLFFKEETEKYKFKHLSSGLLFLPYGVAVDEFQHRVYENPSISPLERRKLWRDIELKYFPDLDYDGHAYLESGGKWQLQSHIYQRPFYYIDYTLAQVCAFQFWVRMQQDFKSAWKDYLNLCKAGGSLSFLQLVELAGLESPFKPGVLQKVAEQISGWLDQINDEEL